MSDPNQRLIAWEIKTDTGRVKQVLDDLRPDVLKRYEAAVAGLCEMETKARQTLNAAEAHTITYVPCLSYARQLYKLSRQQGISPGRALLSGPKYCSTNGRTAVWTRTCLPESGLKCSTPPPRRRRAPSSYSPLPLGRGPGVKGTCRRLLDLRRLRHILLPHGHVCTRRRQTSG